MPPQQESRRPLLPQHARHCPVLEAGSGLGYLVYPPLQAHEAFFVEYLGDGRYRFTFYVGKPGADRQPIYAITMSLPAGGIGKIREEVQFAGTTPPVPAEAACQMARIFVVPEDFGTPAGAVTIKGATNFQTPEGWDTVYTSVINNVERPVVPVLVVRVETDWYPHDSEFRYVLQPGEGIAGAYNMPVGQVFFVPREPVTLRDCTDAEVTAIRAAKQAFAREKALLTQATPYGLQYSPHYARQAKARRPESEDV